LPPAEIDDLLLTFDQTDPALQRRIIARYMIDRTVLLDACRKTAAADERNFGEMQGMLEAVIQNVTRKP